MSENVCAFLHAEGASNFDDPTTVPINCSLRGLAQVRFDFAVLPPVKSSLGRSLRPRARDR